MYKIEKKIKQKQLQSLLMDFTKIKNENVCACTYINIKGRL